MVMGKAPAGLHYPRHTDCLDLASIIRSTSETGAVIIVIYDPGGLGKGSHQLCLFVFFFPFLFKVTGVGLRAERN